MHGNKTQSVGGMISGLISTYIIWDARQLGAPSWPIARMVVNTLLDTTIGAILARGMRFACDRRPLW